MSSSITGLPSSLTGSGIDADADLLPVYDQSAGTTKKITVTEVSKALTFLPSGTGAISETVQAALRRLVFLSQYDTSGHYDTAKAALSKTEKMAFGGSVELMANVASTTKTAWRVPNINTSHADFSFQVGSGALEAFNSDTTWAFGYNVNHEKAGVPGLHFNLESDFDNGSGPGIELHLIYQTTTGTAYRPLSFRIEDGSHFTDWSIDVSRINFNDQTHTHTAMLWQATSTTGLLSLNPGTSFEMLVVDDGAGNYENVAFSFSSNELRIKPTHGGTGNANRGLHLSADGTGSLVLEANGGGAWFVNGSTSNFCAWNDNTDDIGNSGSNRPRTGYFGTSVIIGTTETPVVSGMLQVQNAGDAFQILRNTTANIELLIGTDSSVAIVGTMTAHDVELRTNNGTRWKLVHSTGGGLSANGNLRFSHGTSALATNATEGFFHIQSCAGAPSGTPATIPTGQIPMVWDSSNLQLYAYTGGAWKKSAVFT